METIYKEYVEQVANVNHRWYDGGAGRGDPYMDAYGGGARQGGTSVCGYAVRLSLLSGWLCCVFPVSRDWKKSGVSAFSRHRFFFKCVCVRRFFIIVFFFFVSRRVRGLLRPDTSTVVVFACCP